MAKVTAAEKRRSLIELLIALVLLVLLAAILFVEVSRSASVIWREAATTSRYTVTASYEGYIFRDEEILTATNNGPIEYLCTNGDTVAKDAPIAYNYRDEGGMEKRGQAALLYEEIATLEAALAESESSWESACLSSWIGLTAATSGGNWQSVGDTAAPLATSLAQRDVARDKENNTAEIRAKIDALYDEVDELLRYVDDPATVRSKTGGIFYDTIDGLEPYFGIEAIGTLTPEQLAEKLAAAPSPVDTVGKLITSDEFYLVIPLSAADAENYLVGNDYSLQYTHSGTTLSMQLSDIRVSGATAILIFYGDAISTEIGVSRRQSVVIARERVEGIALPLTAVENDGERDFVYVEVDGKAEIRWIEPIFSENGVLLVAPSDKSGYLKEGDAVLVTARSLYEGKVIG